MDNAGCLLVGFLIVLAIIAVILYFLVVIGVYIVMAVTAAGAAWGTGTALWNFGNLLVQAHREEK